MQKSANDVVIVDGVRTPFAKAGTALKDVHAAELGQIALLELIARTNLNKEIIDEVIIGNVGNPADAVNISRVVALRAGLPQSVSTHTVHRNCASALESLAGGFNMIKAGSASAVIAGGTENMSQAPLLFGKKMTDLFGKLQFSKTTGEKLAAMMEFRPSYLAPRVTLMEALTDPFVGINMGQTAEILAKEFGISRLEQDQFALQSHLKAVASTDNGKLQEEMTPVFIGPAYKEVLDKDSGPRVGQTIEALQKLKPYFDKRTGSVTVGNSCPLTDGAAMMLLMSRERAEAEGYKPLARIVSYAFAGLEPERMGLGPAYASPKALDKAKLNLSQMDLIEINEAFAAQVIACQKALASDKWCQEKLGRSAVGVVEDSKLNVNGGAIAIGHPVGTTGTRLVLTLAKELKRRGKQYGLATLCIGGGQGGAMVIENEG
ncbi:MAG: thiolase family protein [Bdellovibrionaceae bacterium]|nr:thiolase family protein [Pseudobdellovibrionaceae bacterium]